MGMLFDNSTATKIWGVSGTTLEPVSLVAKHGERSTNWQLCWIKWDQMGTPQIGISSEFLTS